MSKTGTFLSVADDQEGAEPSIITPDNPLPVSLCDESGNTVVEQFSTSVKTIETDHARIHDGQGYSLSGVMATIATATSAYFLLNPVSAIHWRFYKFVTDGTFDIELYENPTVTDNGTPLTPVNRNRFSSNTSDAVIYSAPTVTGDGTFLDRDSAIVTGAGANTAGELEGVAVEWILSGSKTYLLKLINTDNGGITPSYRFFWYHS